jgi:hypothetical protein
VADAGVERLALELDARRLQRGACGGDIGHAQRDGVGARHDLVRLQQRERQVAGLELREVLVRARIRREPERLAVEALRALEVARPHGEVVGALDADHAVVPSAYGA